MNILIPHNWLLDHLETEASCDQIQEYLSLSGPSVERILDKEGEPVYDIEVTTNRVDSMSVHGIAREAAVILNRFGIKAELKPLDIPEEIQPTIDQTLPLPEIENDPELCNRILTVVLKGAEPKPTPDWMAKRLKQIDQQVHNSQVDITNYVTHDLGHPCHAFDYDKMMDLGGKIIVKQAETGKKFTTLDGEEYETVGGEIVFENDQGEIIDLPAVKGTHNTSVDGNTKNILFWIENLDSKKVRHASMSHAIRTVAAQLNEKHVDPFLGKRVILKGVELYQKLTGADIASQLYDQFPNQELPQPVIIKLSTISNYLGLELETDEINEILQQLGCKVEETEKKGQPALQVQPPSFRPDLAIPADIVEEIARIYGYHQLPSKLMATEIPTQEPECQNFSLEEKIKNYLAAIGWQEVYTYSLVSAELAQQSGYEIEEHLKLLNPLTEDKTYLRRSLIPSLQEAIAQNPQREKLSFFELANVYHPQQNELPDHEMHITLVSTKDYRKVRGNIEALLKQFYLDEIQITEDEQIYLNGPERTQLGTVTILDNGHIAFDLDYQALIKEAKKYPEYQPLPKTSPIIEDLTFTIKEGQAVGPVIDQIQQTDPLIKTAHLTDVYQRNFSFRIKYWDRQQNLTNEQVQPIRQKLVAQVEGKFEAELVGEVG